jgi:hypothetical protein
MDVQIGSDAVNPPDRKALLANCVQQKRLDHFSRAFAAFCF